MKIGSKIKRLREAKGITQRDMEDLLGVSHGTYCNWESDLHEVKLSKVPVIAKILDVDVKELLGDSNSNGVSVSQHFKDSNIYGAVIVLTDKEVAAQWMEILKDKI